jgi:DNA-binding transcriptional LysR family regulator
MSEEGPKSRSRLLWLEGLQGCWEFPAPSCFRRCLFMEMQQVRYFLAVARQLNFTRAAEECHVAQPSLTRAIKELEEELGGELVRRERNLTHLSELGQRMLPLMQQCYESAQAAKQIATFIKTGALAPLAIALPTSLNIELMLPFLKELVRAMPGLNLKFMRGTSADVSQQLRRGDADLAVAGKLIEVWDRLEWWPLFTECYRVFAARAHRFNGKTSIPPELLREERLICRPYCEDFDRGNTLLSALGIDVPCAHNVGSDNDFIALLNAGLGIGFAPESSATSPELVALAVEGFKMKRTVFVYAVAGRQRSMAASTLIKMLRAADWSPLEASAKAAS